MGMGVWRLPADRSAIIFIHTVRRDRSRGRQILYACTFCMAVAAMIAAARRQAGRGSSPDPRPGRPVSDPSPSFEHCSSIVADHNHMHAYGCLLPVAQMRHSPLTSATPAPTRRHAAASQPAGGPGRASSPGSSGDRGVPRPGGQDHAQCAAGSSRGTRGRVSRIHVATG